MSELLRAGVLVTRRHLGYKDVPGVRYHYPKKIYPRALATLVGALVGALVLTCEPRRGGTSALSPGVVDLRSPDWHSSLSFWTIPKVPNMGSQNSAQPIETVIRNARVRDEAFHNRVVENVYLRMLRAHRVCMTNGNGRAEADAAHVRPVANDGPDTVRNGIALMKSTRRLCMVPKHAPPGSLQGLPSCQGRNSERPHSTFRDGIAQQHKHRPPQMARLA